MSAFPTDRTSQLNRAKIDSAEQKKTPAKILATAYMMVHTTRRLSTNTFWFVETHRHIYTETGRRVENNMTAGKQSEALYASNILFKPPLATARVA